MTDGRLTTSVLIPSFRRPDRLRNCLQGLAAQTTTPDQVLVVWQGDDTATRDLAAGFARSAPYLLDVMHSVVCGVVPAENLALAHATGAIIALIDDDAVPAADWLARHVALYADPKVGAVGGPADNYYHGELVPRRSAEPVGIIAKFGKVYGNTYCQPLEWRTREPRAVDHLVGCNMSLRRAAFGAFETGLRNYWQSFEMDACLQVTANGYAVLFDFANVVEHHITNLAFAPNREGDLTTKVVNPAYNKAFVLAKHGPPSLTLLRLAYLTLLGSVNQPGMLAFAVACRRYGRPYRELVLLGRTWRAIVTGWRAGRRWRRR